MVQAMLNAFRLPDVRRKLIFTFAILVVFRFIAHIPVPGVNADKLKDLFAGNQLMGMLDLFSGGALENFSIAAMGVYPYITSTIIMQLIIPIVPRFRELSKEGDTGRKRLNQITHWLTIPLAAVQAFGTARLLGGGVLENFGTGDTLLPTASIILSMTAGTIFLVWLGELITENGIGNGVSIIIFAGIVSKLPLTFAQSLFGRADIGAALAFAVLGLATVAAIVLVQEAQRRIPVQYAKRIRGNKMYGGQSTHIPLRVNSAGMIPLIFAMSLMLLPGTIASYFVDPGNKVAINGANVIGSEIQASNGYVITLDAVMLPRDEATTAGTPAASSGEASTLRDVLTVVTEDGRFKTLVQGIQMAGLADTLKGPGPYTLLAPTDEAFAQLPSGKLEELLANTDKLKAVLLYHVIPRKLAASDIRNLSVVQTVQGSEVTVKVEGGGIISNIAKFVRDFLGTGSPAYWLFYFALVVGFTFFYAKVLFQQQNLAENLQKYGGFVPGIRPGRPTAEYLDKVLNRITWMGALFLGLIAVLPFFTQSISPGLILSSTGLLIVVGVVLDTMKQLEAQLLMRHYEGFIK